MSSRHKMIEDLCRELGNRPGVAEVKVEETHISWVLLAGNDAYKIKKPVTLPFLDFSTFEARERACRSEVLVNRRLAPRSYLGVVAVRRTPEGGFTLGPRGVVVDWAVRMVRLDDRRRADELLLRGELTPEDVDRLAIGLADFHADARTDSAIAAFGSPREIEHNVVANFVALREASSRLARDEDLRRLEQWQIAFLRGHADLFERRRNDGAVRDGHGDLRLEHVFFRPDGDFEVIDAIEFDERFRIGDVAADVAFLAMDFSRLGRVDLAERFLAAYARASSDYELYRLVDFYESYRACVRAKIAALQAADRDATAEARVRARASKRRYLLLAQSAANRSLVQPTVVAIGGVIAAGKSTLADAIAAELGAPVVDADRTRKRLLGVSPTTHVDTRPWHDAYDPAFSERVYEEVLRRAEAVLASGRSVVLDASFRTKAARARARELANQHGVPFRFFECVAAHDVCRRRLAARDRATSASDGRLEVFDAFVSGFEAIDELPETEHIRIETGGAPEEAVEQMKRHVTTWPRGFGA